jgi:orotidine-5'-phosphate decarboxylase
VTFQDVFTAGSRSVELCVGVDPHPAVLADWGYPDSPEGLRLFVGRIVAELGSAGVRVVKPQVALFERHGIAGMTALASLLANLREGGLLSIGDAKRGDIGTTMAAYAQAWLTPGADFEVDALTVSPYLGVGALKPALELAAQHQKGVFVLAATSNPEASDLQSSRGPSDDTVARQVFAEIDVFHSRYPDTRPTHGVVVGATVNQSALGLDLAKAPGMTVLAPGFGAQGVSLSDASSLFPHTERLLPVAARSLVSGSPEGFADRIRHARSELGL